MPTTSRRSNRTRSKGSFTQGSPLRGIALTVTLSGAHSDDLERIAAEKGLAVERKGRDVSFKFEVDTADEALERLGVLAVLLAPKR